MNYLHVIALIFGLLASIFLYLGNSKDTKKDKEDIKEHVTEKLDLGTINKEAQKYKPLVNIQTKNFTSDKNGEDRYIDIIVEAKKFPLKSIAVDYPLQGIIKDFQDLNSTTDAEASIREAQGRDEENTVNNINLFVKNIINDRKLTYRVFYKPTLQGISLGFRDRYEVVFSWQYKGNDYNETVWRLIKNDEITTSPPLRIKNTAGFNRLLTPEEIKQNFEQGNVNREFE